MKKLVVLLFILVLSAAFPVLTSAQSRAFPNNDTSCVAPNRNIALGTSAPNDKMNFKVKLKNYGQIDSGQVTVTACDDGRAVARKGANALCSAALAAGWTISSAIGCVPAACCTAPVTTSTTVQFEQPGGGADHFTIACSAAPASEKYDVTIEDTEIITNLLVSTNAGNSIGNDPPPFWLFEAPPVSGSYSFRITHACGGPNPVTFTVNATGKTTLQIAQEVANGFNGLTLGCTTLPAIVYAHEEIGKYSALPGDFNCQFFVRVRNANTVTMIDVKGPAGAFIVSDANDGTPAATAVPALSPWGVAALIGILLATSLWFLRRRFGTA